VVAAAAPTAGDAIVALQSAMGVVHAPRRPKQIVDVQQGLKAITFEHLPQSTWPKSGFADWLKEEVGKLVLAGVKKPFVYVDLKRYCLPPWVLGEGAACDVDDEDGGKAKAHTLSFPVWACALQRLAVASEIAGQWSVAAAEAHFQCCCRVADEGRVRGMPLYLSVIYDEVAREHWADKSRGNIDQFDVCVASVCIDRELLARAEGIVALRKKQPPREMVRDAGRGRDAGKGRDVWRGPQQARQRSPQYRRERSPYRGRRVPSPPRARQSGGVRFERQTRR
jgi:hypothetical protein